MTAPVIVIGAGACGMTAALAARDAGASVVVLERDAAPTGSTAMSGAMIPAPGSRWQARRGIEDDPELMVADIRRQTSGEADETFAHTIAAEAAPCLEWLADAHGLPFDLIDGWQGFGHSRARMVTIEGRTGARLLAALSAAATGAGADLMTGARVTSLFAEADGRVTGIHLERRGGSQEDIGCRALVLATCGFGANKEMVRTYMPRFAGLTYFGHDGNDGDGIRWGIELGAAVRHMGSVQAHGGLAVPYNIGMSLDPMLAGAIQVNSGGVRFCNETENVSTQAAKVVAQPGGVAWNIYGAAQFAIGMKLAKFVEASEAGALREYGTAQDLAAAIGAPAAVLGDTLAQAARLATGQESDPLGRDFSKAVPFEAPYFAVKVTGALYHTQGGLVVDENAAVLREDGTALPNLFAGGGTACGLSGSNESGYLPGNGLLSALVLGRLAGASAAAKALPD